MLLPLNSNCTLSSTDIHLPNLEQILLDIHTPFPHQLHRGNTINKQPILSFL